MRRVHWSAADSTLTDHPIPLVSRDEPGWRIDSVFPSVLPVPMPALTIGHDDCLEMAGLEERRPGVI